MKHLKAYVHVQSDTLFITDGVLVAPMYASSRTKFETHIADKFNAGAYGTSPYADYADKIAQSYKIKTPKGY